MRTEEISSRVGYQISVDQMFDIARARNFGESWAAIGRQYGMLPTTIKAAYLRKSREMNPS